MEPLSTASQMLELLTAPAFCTESGIIARVNHAAERLLLSPGSDVRTLLTNAREEYETFTEGVIYLTLCLSGSAYGASVTRMDGFDVFVLEESDAPAQLRAFALAAKELRKPLSGIMAIADSVLPAVVKEGADDVREQVAQLNRGLYQVLRIVGNMSDAARYLEEGFFRPETRDICAILDEIFRQAAAFCEQSHIQFRFQVPSQVIYCSVDAELLQRAVLNLISNALKFVSDGGWISCKAVQKGNKLHLTVSDSGSGIPEALRSSVFFRYLRSPSIEDGRYGIGLGMVLVREAATAHGGTVFIEQPPGQGARITMTLSLEQNPGTVLRSPLLQVDYAGERSHDLIELSDCLDTRNYDSSALNG